MTRLASVIHGVAARTGVDLIRYSSLRHPIGRRMRLIRSLGVDLVLDVGANSGQFATELRRHGYTGRIVSFEPLSAPYAVLSLAAGRDRGWETYQCALGSADHAATMNVAANSASSSLLEMLPLHENAAPEAKFVGSEAVTIRRLDGMLSDIRRGNECVYLKVDVQGAEQEVLRGASETIQLCAAVQLELSLFPLYEGGGMFQETVALMDRQGFQLVGVEPGFADVRDGRLLQLDGLFVRKPGGVRAQHEK
jgi:FkbM family methyltransferase